jgi:hypothetical protein
MPAFPDRNKPATFDDDVATPGKAWLDANPIAKPKERPPSYWTKKPIKKKLRQNFRSLCGYTLMHEMRGTVDHFISWDTDRKKAYEWDNYRFCAGTVNSSKKTADDAVFDPWEIEFEWFEIHLPSMIMVVSRAAPPALKQKLEFTLGRLPIADTDEVIDYRAEYYDGYKLGEMTLAWIERKAPVLAASIRAWEQAHPGTPLP